MLLAIADGKSLATLIADTLAAGPRVADDPATLADARVGARRLAALGHARTWPPLMVCRAVARVPQAPADTNDVRDLLDDFDLLDEMIVGDLSRWTLAASLGHLATTPAHAARYAAESSAAASGSGKPATAAFLATRALGDAELTVRFDGRDHQVHVRVDAEFELLIVDDIGGGLEGVELRLVGAEDRPLQRVDVVHNGHADLRLAELSSNDLQALTLAARRPA